MSVPPGMTAKLVYMANQIARFFASQPGGHAAADVAEHLRLYWAPAMRRDILAYVGSGGAGLHPAALSAVRSLQPVGVD